MNKLFKTILIITIAVFSASLLFIPSTKAVEPVQFDGKQIFVDFDGLPFNLSNWAPGMSDQKSIIIKNNEDFNINVYFKAKETSGDNILANALTITIDGESNHLSDLFNDDITLSPVDSGKSQNYNIVLSFDEDAGNEYQGKTINFDFIIIAEEVGKGGNGGTTVIIPGGGGGGGSYVYGLEIYNENASALTADPYAVVIEWETNKLATSRVIYSSSDEAHEFDWANPPNYGYARSTKEDSEKMRKHLVSIFGLEPGVTYFYRCVSHTSPDETISTEHSFTMPLIEEEQGEEEEEEEEEIISQEETPSEEESPQEEALAPSEEIEEPSVTEGEEVIVSSEEERTETDGVETEGITEKTSEDIEGEEEKVFGAESMEGFEKFLAAIGNVFGLKNLWWISIVIIVILFTLFLLSKKKRKKEE